MSLQASEATVVTLNTDMSVLRYFTKDLLFLDLASDSLGVSALNQNTFWH